MDLNGLISTIITATSALVAIIGGFLVSRVITLSGERSAIERRLKEINNDLSTKQKMLEQIEKDFLEEEIEGFINDYCEEIIIEEKSIQEILDEDDSSDLTLEILEPYIEELFSIRDEIFKLIEETDENYVLPNNLNELMKDNNIIIEGKKDLHELVYKTIWNSFPDEPSNSLFGINVKLPAIDHRNILKSTSVFSQQMFRDRIKERNILRSEVQTLIIRKSEQKKILGDYGKPNGLWGGLWVLIYSCIVGIAYPSVLLPYPENTYNDVTTKWFLLILFFSELIALFIYLGVSMSKLTRNNSSQNLEK